MLSSDELGLGRTVSTIHETVSDELDDPDGLSLQCRADVHPVREDDHACRSAVGIRLHAGRAAKRAQHYPDNRNGDSPHP